MERSSDAVPSSGTYIAEATVSVLATRHLLDASLTCHAHTPRHAHIDGAPVLQGRSTSVSLNITRECLQGSITVCVPLMKTYIIPFHYVTDKHKSSIY